jgi:hypothetical protein
VDENTVKSFMDPTQPKKFILRPPALPDIAQATI